MTTPTRTNVDLRRDSANQATVRIGRLVLWFSYETVIAFSTPATGLVVSENVWSNTTGKHLNAIDGGDKGSRVDHDTFAESLDRALAKVQYLEG